MPDDQLSPDWYKGLSYLGKPTSISLTGTDPGSPASLSAGGAPVAAPSIGVTGSPTGAAGAAGTGPSALDYLRGSVGLGEKAVGIGETVRRAVADPGAASGIISGSGGFLSGAGTATTPALAAGAVTPAVEPIAGVTGNLASLPGEAGATAASTAAATGAGAEGLSAGATSAVGGAGFSILTKVLQDLFGTPDEKNWNMGDKWGRAAMDLLSPGLNDVLGMTGTHLFGPSADWMKFPGKVGANLQSQANAVSTLARAINAATTPEEIQAAIQAHNSALGSSPGTRSRVGAPDPSGITEVGDFPGMHVHGQWMPGSYQWTEGGQPAQEDPGWAGHSLAHSGVELTPGPGRFGSAYQGINELIKQKMAGFQTPTASAAPTPTTQAPGLNYALPAPTGGGTVFPFEGQ